MKDYKDIILLVRASLGENIPKEKFKDTNFDLVYTIAKDQSIANTLFYAIEKLNININNDLYSEWEQLRDDYIIVDIKQDEEGKLIKRIFTENNIDYVLLKGSVLKHLYPTSDMRSMGDIDILIKEKNRKKARTILLDLGFEIEQYKKDNEDKYIKSPMYVVEVHTELFDKYTVYSSYYNNNWDSLYKKDNKKGTSYNFSKIEDFYVYILSHFAKHYYSNGAGFRNIIDIYLFRKKYKNKLDYTYINKKLKEYDLKDFNDKLVNFIDVYFYDGKENDNSKEILNYVFANGTYGSDKASLERGINEYGSKGKYVLHRIFPPIEKMKKLNPILNKCILLLPIFYIKRILEKTFKQGDRVLNEIKILIQK